VNLESVQVRVGHPFLKFTVVPRDFTHVEIAIDAEGFGFTHKLQHVGASDGANFRDEIRVSKRAREHNFTTDGVQVCPGQLPSTVVVVVIVEKLGKVAQVNVITLDDFHVRILDELLGGQGH